MTVEKTRRQQVLIERNTTHGMSKCTEYSNWKDMKKRCFNPANKRYKDYAERGISVHADFVDSFPKFLEEIGDKPQDGGKWSVGRIDNNGWYTYGNLRWETNSQQAQNHTRQRNNTSGHTGVKYRTRMIGKGLYSTWTASWKSPCGRGRSKEFSADKYGYDIAFEMALKYRLERIAELNALGAEYAESHGSNK